MSLVKRLKDTEFTQLEAATRFKLLLDEFNAFALRRETPILPYRPEDRLSHFKALSFEQQERILRSFSYYCECLLDAEEEDGFKPGALTLELEKQLLWAFFKRAGWHPTPDLLPLIKKNDVIEVYDVEFVQRYRNFRFLNVCSYSVEELVAYEFTELYERPEEITREILSDLFAAFKGKRKGPHQVQVPVHTLRERFSPAKRLFRIEQGVIAPLFNKEKEPVAIVATLQADVLQG